MPETHPNCHACGFKTETKMFESGRPKREMWLCHICANTAAGNAMFYSDLYVQSRDVLLTIAYCTNLILEKIDSQERL